MRQDKLTPAEWESVLEDLGYYPWVVGEPDDGWRYGTRKFFPKAIAFNCESAALLFAYLVIDYPAEWGIAPELTEAAVVRIVARRG